MERQIYLREIAKKWQRILKKHLRYRRPNAINYEMAVEAVKSGEKVWVLPMMMKAGK